MFTKFMENDKSTSPIKKIDWNKIKLPLSS